MFDDITFKNEDLLLQALAALGWDQSKIEQGTDLRLVGYQGDVRRETADIVIRRKHVGSASNDIGFKRTADGFIPIVSEYDQSTIRRGRLVPDLRVEYGKGVAKRLATRYRSTGKTEETAEAITIKIRV